MWRTFFMLLASFLWAIFTSAVAWHTVQQGDVQGVIICVVMVPLGVCGGIIYLRRWLRERRVLKMADVLRPAACRGDAAAQRRMADLYSELGMDAEAYRFYAAAAKGGDAGAMYQLGVDLMPGVGAPCREDEEEGIAWLSRAYEGGVTRAAEWLAELYAAGSEFTPANPELARLWRSRAATHTPEPGQHREPSTH